jgi:hypothetical protein
MVDREFEGRCIGLVLLYWPHESGPAGLVSAQYYNTGLVNLGLLGSLEEDNLKILHRDIKSSMKGLD